MRSLITLGNINRRTYPLVQATARLTQSYIDPNGIPRVVQMTAGPTLTPAFQRSRSLRVIGGGAIMDDLGKIGKSVSYQLIGAEALVELSIMKQYPGKVPMRRSVYLRAAPSGDQATLRIRIGTAALVTLAQGPLTVLTSAEAQRLFLNCYKPSLYIGKSDLRGLRLEINEGQKTEVMKEVATIDDQGAPVVVTIRRRMRAVQI